MIVRHRRLSMLAIAWGSLAAACAPGLLLASNDGRPPRNTVPEEIRAEQLVSQLGSASYRQREQAEDLLQRMGAAALPFLRGAASHSDLEIRYRARDLLDRIEQVEQKRILREFLSTGDPELGERLHGWGRFTGIAGSDLSARALFADMHQAEPEIMRLSNRSGPELSALIEKRSLHFRQSSQRSPSARMSTGTLAVFLFAMLDPQTELSGGANSLLSVVLRQSKITQALSEQEDGAFRRLMARWIADADDVPPSQRVAVAVAYSFETGIVPALELIRSGARGSQMQNAIFAIAQLGGSDHIADLEPLLNDESVLAEHQQAGAHLRLPSLIRTVAEQLNDLNALQYAESRQADPPVAEQIAFTSRVCDVALVAMIHLSGQSPHDYGFSKLPASSQFQNVHNTAGFDSDDLRARAISQWGLWHRVQRQQSHEIDETAVEGVRL